MRDERLREGGVSCCSCWATCPESLYAPSPQCTTHLLDQVALADALVGGVLAAAEDADLCNYKSAAAGSRVLPPPTPPQKKAPTSPSPQTRENKASPTLGEVT
jgi:hypothetical protein